MANSTSKAWRWRPIRLLRFSLRTLLMATAVLAILLAVPVYRARQQREAVATIEAAGGVVAYDFELDALGNRLPSVVEPIAIRCQSVLDVHFFASVESVQLHDGRASSEKLHAALTRLSALPSARNLNFYDIDFSEQEFRQLRRLEQLQQLSLHSCKFDERWLDCLPGTAPLWNLTLNYTEVGDIGLRNLSRSRSIVSLNLVATNVTDDGLRYLAPLNQIKNLDLAHTQITDEGLRHLKGLPQLSLLLVYGGPTLTDAGIAELKASHPNLGIGR